MAGNAATSRQISNSKLVVFRHPPTMQASSRPAESTPPIVVDLGGAIEEP